MQDGSLYSGRHDVRLDPPNSIFLGRRIRSEKYPCRRCLPAARLSCDLGSKRWLDPGRAIKTRADGRATVHLNGTQDLDLGRRQSDWG